jgi:hypothetical protein
MMTFPKVDRNDPRKTRGPNSYGKMAGSEFYEGRGAMPETGADAKGIQVCAARGTTRAGA